MMSNENAMDFEAEDKQGAAAARVACIGITSAAMKIVGLVSGGKDSCMNMLVCQRFGHEARELAGPPPFVGCSSRRKYLCLECGPECASARKHTAFLMMSIEVWCLGSHATRPALRAAAIVGRRL